MNSNSRGSEDISKWLIKLLVFLKLLVLLTLYITTISLGLHNNRVA